MLICSTFLIDLIIKEMNIDNLTVKSEKNFIKPPKTQDVIKPEAKFLINVKFSVIF